MTDKWTKEKRSSVMSKIRSADTKPEMILRCGLHRLGLRYRLNNSDLPGSPDLVFPKYKAVVFVHGCYWHRHPGCKDASVPKSNQSFWLAKFNENIKRDARVKEELLEKGWKVIVVWECELNKDTIATIEKVAYEIKGNGLNYSMIGKKKLDRKYLITAAEKKVRDRLDSYGKGNSCDEWNKK